MNIFCRMSCFVSVLATLMILSTCEACYPLPTPTTLPPAPCPLENMSCVDVRQTNVLAKKTVSSPLPLMCSKTSFILIISYWPRRRSSRSHNVCHFSDMFSIALYLHLFSSLSSSHKSFHRPNRVKYTLSCSVKILFRRGL